jgi:hypothetical protein
MLTDHIAGIFFAWLYSVQALRRANRLDKAVRFRSSIIVAIGCSSLTLTGTKGRKSQRYFLFCIAEILPPAGRQNDGGLKLVYSQMKN